MYGVCCFDDVGWSATIPHIKALLPNGASDEVVKEVLSEKPVPIEGGVSLEGQAKPGPPDVSVPRIAYAFTQIGSGTVIDAIFPEKARDGKGFQEVDPILNVDSNFPPTIIVHGQDDRMVSIEYSRRLYAALQGKGVKSKLVEVPNEDHTFAARMQVGSDTWNLQRQGFDFLESLL